MVIFLFLFNYPEVEISPFLIAGRTKEKKSIVPTPRPKGRTVAEIEPKSRNLQFRCSVLSSEVCFFNETDKEIRI